MADVIGSWKVYCSRGPRIIRRGAKWRDMLTGSTWEVVEPSGTTSYSPSGLGGTIDFWCKPLGEVPAHWAPYARADGCIVFCGDSIAAGLLDGAANHSGVAVGYSETVSRRDADATPQAKED